MQNQADSVMRGFSLSILAVASKNIYSSCPINIWVLHLDHKHGNVTKCHITSDSTTFPISFFLQLVAQELPSVILHLSCSCNILKKW